MNTNISMIIDDTFIHIDFVKSVGEIQEPISPELTTLDGKWIKFWFEVDCYEFGKKTICSPDKGDLSVRRNQLLRKVRTNNNSQG